MGDAADHHSVAVRVESRSMGDAHSLAIRQEAVLREACDARLGPVEWFRSAWQHGGAATGFAEWHAEEGGHPARAMVKLPVGPVELFWSKALGEADFPVVPRLLASGSSLGDVDVSWLVVEKLEGRPLSTQFDQSAVVELIETLVGFHAATTLAKPIDQRPAAVDWETNVAKARVIVRAGGFADALRWNDALKHVQKAIPTLVARWNARPITVWCHGDLHPGNALRRAGGDRAGSCVLIDLAMVHPGHWIEDAVYLERQYWGHAEQLHGIKPVSTLARLRRERGLPVEDSYAELAIVRRVLMASLVPLFLDREGNSRYVHGALEMIEKYLPQVH